MKNNRLLLYIILCHLIIVAGRPAVLAQVTLGQMIVAARDHAPIRSMAEYAKNQNEHIQKSLGTKLLPQFVLSGQATYQSDVTQIGTDIPALGIVPLSFDQYKISGEVSQVVYDGGIVSGSRQLQQNHMLSEIVETEVALEGIRKQIILIYFQILELDKRKEILELKKSLLEANLGEIQTAVDLGALLKSEEQSLRVAILQLEQEDDRITAIRKAQIEVLQILTGQDLTASTDFTTPIEPLMSTTILNQNATKRLFELQENAIQLSFDNSQIIVRPRFDLFVQGGYGKPALNFLKNEFDFYYIAGIRGRWNLSNFYSKKSDNEVMLLNKQKIGAKKNTHTDKIRAEATQYVATVAQMEASLTSDDEIIELYGAIRQTAEVQLQNGAIKSTELIEKINDENTAQINRVVHELTKNKTLHLLLHVTGNYSIQ